LLAQMMMGRPRNILSAMSAAAMQKMRASAELSESGSGVHRLRGRSKIDDK
jgi:hypothetical protein